MELPLQVHNFLDRYLILFAAEERLTDKQVCLSKVFFTRFYCPCIDPSLINLLDTRPGAFPKLVEHPASLCLRQHTILSMANKDAL